MLVVEPVDADVVRRGDVVVFPGADGRVTVHRVIRMTPTVAFTKGDSRPEVDDQPVSRNRLTGKVVRRVRLGHTAPVVGAWRGSAQSKVLGYVGRIVPGRAGKAGRVADCLVGLSTSLQFCWGHLLRTAPPSDRGDSLLYLGRRPIGLRSAEGRDAWHIVWPYSLLVQPSTVPEPTARRGR